MNKLLVILGPTATGKTDLALHLAKKLNGELVACDSRQVYKDLDIGTGKLPGKYKILKKLNSFWEMDQVKIWMYDVVSVRKQYSVADYVNDAQRVIEEMRSRDKLPIIVGGTGFYLKALLEGIPNLEIPINKKLRQKLQKLSLEELQKKLQDLSAIKWQELNESDRQNPRRLIRAIEILSINGYEKKEKNTTYEYNTLKIGLTAPREILYKKVDLRVLSRITQGMVQEAKNLNNKGVSLKRMRTLGLEYGVLADYLEGRLDNEQMIRVMQDKIHSYVRRQLTWFKKETDVSWFDITSQNLAQKVEKKVLAWYNS